MGLGHVELAMVQAEAAKSRIGPWVLNCQAADGGNMHTLLHWGTEEQKEQYLRPLCEGTKASCFAMTEPGVAGSDSAAGARAICWGSPAWRRPAWPTACAGSPTPRWRWT